MFPILASEFVRYLHQEISVCPLSFELPKLLNDTVPLIELPTAFFQCFEGTLSHVLFGYAIVANGNKFGSLSFKMYRTDCPTRFLRLAICKRRNQNSKQR